MIVLKRVCRFIFFLLVLVILFLSFNNKWKNINLQRYEEEISYLNEDFQYFTLAMAKKLDSEYEIFF